MKKVLPKKSVTTKTKSAKKNIVATPLKNELFVVGIGASAGGLEALKLFFDNFPAGNSVGFVVVQHLDPTHKSLLTELIRGHTKMKVLEATDGVKVMQDSVYIIPPNKYLSIQGGSLQLSEFTENRAVRRPIDLFFHSLAEDQKEKAIGIILSGTGTEGTLGLKEIKAEGGFTLVQEPFSAQFAGMPQNAIAAKTADFVLPPQKMAARLIQYIKSSRKGVIDLKPGLLEPIGNQLKKIFMVIRNQTGYDFSNYKSNTIVRRITKRIALNQLESIESYIELLQKEPLEVERLFNDFLIGVTAFFRDKEVFDNVQNKVIPYLLQKCQVKQEVRIWVCGCSTGEEAYSLAILFREALEKNNQFIKVMIFASDIDKAAIEYARNGRYTTSALENIIPGRLSKFFIMKEYGYQIKKEIRDMVVFAHHDLVKDPPFSKMDLICCRNLLIYMNSELQKKIIPVFHYSLNSDGILILGTSESIGDNSDMFGDFDSRNKIFIKKVVNTIRKSAKGFELPGTKQPAVFPESVRAPITPKKSNVSILIEKYLLDHYSPPAVIIDKNNDVLYFSGNTGLYLQPPVGDAKLNVLNMAKKGLKPAMDAAIKEVRSGTSEIQINGVEVKVNDRFKAINLLIRQPQTTDADMGVLMVIFEPVEQSVKEIPEPKIEKSVKSLRAPSDLEKELRVTQEQLQAAINDLDFSRETLQSTNEEYQSSNEELQSTNEELETSREELQSVNEELITVNTELQDKIEQLSHSNDDLNNLLTSIDIATIFLDRELKIKRFTPTATKIFNLIPSDIDRPVTHLSANIIYKALAEDVKNSLKTLAVKSADVQGTDGTWYHMRIIPYRTAENIIVGVLITFVEITELKRVEEKLKNTNEHLNLILENLPAVPFTCTTEPEMKFSFVGKSSEKVTGFLPQQFMNSKDFWITRVHPLDRKKMLAAFTTISKKGSFEHPFRWKCADGKYKHFINFIRFAAQENDGNAYIVGVWQEIGDTRLFRGLK